MFLTFRLLDKPRRDENWSNVEVTYKSAVESLDGIVSKFKGLASHQTLMKGILRLHPSPETALEPEHCWMLPPANPRFFQRQDLQDQLDQYLPDDDSKFSSVAILGLGGIGKTQVALNFAYSRMDDLGVILWINSETEASLAQSFSQASLKCAWLQLSSANLKDQGDEERRIILLNWLQTTGEVHLFKVTYKI